ncbi:hypothetical protein JHD50_13460 [Sulfurimonas sp. MAG313]|nr:hypothetical protein [Sulfurimonas sp. MAG313]
MGFFHSFEDVGNIELLVVILTGLGEDGVSGAKVLCKKGATILTESEDHAIVDGMPKNARREIKNVKASSLVDIIHEIKTFCV